MTRHRDANPETPSPPWRQLVALRRPQRRSMAAGFALSLLATLSGIALLATSGHFITSMAVAGAGGAAINYYTPAALVRLFAILRSGGRYAERLVTHDATLSILARLRSWLFGKLLPLAPARLGRIRSAELLSRLRADVDTLEHAYLSLWLPTAVAAFSGLSVIVLSALWSIPVALALALAFAAIVIALRAWLARHTQAAAQVDSEGETLRAQLADALAGRAELALFGTEDEFDAQLKATFDRRETSRRQCQRAMAISDAVLASSISLAALLALLLGVTALRAHALNGPGLTLLVMLAIAGIELILPLPSAWARVDAIRSAAQRIFALANTAPAVSDPVAPASPPAASDLQLRKVWMHYDDGNKGLRGLSLDLPAGTRIAIVGPSGCGKSSLAHVLGRLYPFLGDIQLGGTAVESLRIDDVRARIAIVEQSPYLFDATLRDNLRLMCPDAGDAQLKTVLSIAQLDHFLALLPAGLDTWVGANGVSVSGGEARRIAIARALLTDSPILVLDEPTEGLDTLTAAALYAALDKATRGRTLVLITHRLDALATLVDEVATMEAGRLVNRRPVVERRTGAATADRTRSDAMKNVT